MRHTLQPVLDLPSSTTDLIKMIRKEELEGYLDVIMRIVCDVIIIL